MSLVKMPTELLFRIAEQLPESRDLNAFVRTCRWTHNMLNQQLYQNMHPDTHTTSALARWILRRGQLGTLARAYSAGVNLFQPGFCLLIGAVGLSHNEMARWIISETGVDINERNHDGSTALMHAAKAGNIQGVRLLLDHGADVSPSCKHSGTALLYGAIGLSAQGLELLIQRGANLGDRFRHGGDILETAVRSNGLDKVRLLMLKYRVLIPLAGHSRKYLRYAIHQSNVQMTTFLLDHGIPAEGIAGLRPPLYCAIKCAGLAQSETMVRLLLGRGASVNSRGANQRYPLTVAVECKRIRLLKILIDFGADINACTEYGTALEMATRTNAYDCARLLLEHGAQTNIVSSRGNCAVMAAAILSGPRMMELLLEYGANVSIRDAWGRTPLIAAASAGQVGIVQCLVRRQVDLEVVDDMGRTALAAAALCGRNVAAAYLMENGASWDSFPPGFCTFWLSRDYEREYEEEMARAGGPSSRILDVVLSRAVYGSSAVLRSGQAWPSFDV